VLGTWTTAEGQNVRVITDNLPDWGTVADDDPGQNDDPGTETPGDTVDAGWYFNLPKAGEMVVSDVIIRDGKLLVTSFTPGKDPCGSVGSSIFHEMNACTGGAPSKPIFDVNGDHEVNAQDQVEDENGKKVTATGIELPGRVSNPVIVQVPNTPQDEPTEKLIFGPDKILTSAAPQIGIFYWLQVE
jgi:type IV pilus assembly protein PilY1